jgi:hypothetical protein
MYVRLCFCVYIYIYILKLASLIAALKTVFFIFCLKTSWFLIFGVYVNVFVFKKKIYIYIKRKPLLQNVLQTCIIIYSW